MFTRAYKIFEYVDLLQVEQTVIRQLMNWVRSGNVAEQD
jgi:hypothetical protein